jgi:hypothetical protein
LVSLQFRKNEKDRKLKVDIRRSPAAQRVQHAGIRLAGRDTRQIARRSANRLRDNFNIYPHLPSATLIQRKGARLAQRSNFTDLIA